MDWTKKAREFWEKHFGAPVDDPRFDADEKAALLGEIDFAASFASEVERLTRQEGWVSVEERPPDKDAYVQVTTIAHRFPLTAQYKSVRIGGKEYGLFHSVPGRYGLSQVTHWRELPNAPHQAKEIHD